jgi:hypothetical protein
VQSHADEALEPVRHRWNLDAQELLGDRCDQRVGRLQRGPPAAGEHRAVDPEVVVMRAIQRVEVEPPGLLDVAIIGEDRSLVVIDHAPVVPQRNIDVRRHVHEMAGVGHQPAERVGGVERLLRMRRHLHQMDVQVQQTRVGHATWTFERRVEHILRFERARPRGRPAGRQIPQCPGRGVHQRIGIQRGDIEVVAVGGVDLAHRARITGRPDRQVIAGLSCGIPLSDRADQRLLERRRGRRELPGAHARVVSAADRGPQIDLVERLPWLVVVGPDSVSKSPIREREVLVERDRALEAADRLLVIEGIAPNQSAIEPPPRVYRRGRTCAAEGPEIERIRCYEGNDDGWATARPNLFDGIPATLPL